MAGGMGYGGEGNADRIVGDIKDITGAMDEAVNVGQDWKTTQIAMEAQSVKLHRAYSLEQKFMAKLNSTFLSTNYGGAHVLYKTFRNMVIVAGRMSETHEEHRQRTENLSIAQRVLHNGLVKYFRVIPWGTEVYNKYLDKMKKDNTWRTRLQLGLVRSVVTFISLILVMSTVIFILGLLSLAFQGVNSPLYEMTERFENLHNIVQGFTMAVSGEGEGNIFDVLAASLVAAGLAAWFFASGPFGLLIGIAVLAAGVFNLIYNATENLGFSLVSTGYLMGGFLAIIAAGSATILQFIVWIVGWLSPAVAHAIYVASFMARMISFGAILGGLFLLLGVATGKWSDKMALVATALAGILFYVGALALGIATLPVAFFFAATIVLAWVIRKREWVWNNIVVPFFEGLLFLITGVGKAIYFVFNGLYNLIKGPGEWLDRQIGRLETLFSGGYSNPEGSNFIGINSGEFRSRALGGPVSMGTSYLVGERGPEMFVPGSSGTIVPNNKMGGNNITLNINVSGVTDRTDKRALAREISDMISQEVRRSGGQPTRGRF